MLVYTDWLEDYTDVPGDLDAYCERMVMSGSNIETARRCGEGIEGVVVGRVLSIDKHPDADKLIVCRVDIGEAEPLQIVTGAPNVAIGARIPTICDGGRLPDGTRIKKGKLRGVESQGMLCSMKELGYEDKVAPTAHKDGIWLLPEDYPVGRNIVEALGLSGAVVDFEITPNRPDCLSMIGMARETAATFGTAVRYPETACRAEQGQAGDYVAVRIERPELCSRYVARVATDIRIGQSPWWMQKRLMCAGMRPINNIVDVTNYVMLEYGQPIHAFDIREVAGGCIVVDTAKPGERFVTLDGVVRTLDGDMLMIRDEEKALALAGVMGGQDSGIRDDTTTILIESAGFHADSVRKTSKRLGLRTEASSRFEKGLDPATARQAADRVCHLIELIGAGKVVGGAVDAYPDSTVPRTVEVRTSRVNRMLGLALSPDELAQLLRRLEIQVDVRGETLTVTPPSVRLDLLKEIDYVEEAARIYGYDRLPLTLPARAGRGCRTERQKRMERIRQALISMGAVECQTYSFVSPGNPDRIGLAADDPRREQVKLLNPLGEENSVMRTTMLPGLLEVLERNYTRGVKEIRAFEIGNIFIDRPNDEGLPTERKSLVVGFYGSDEDFFTLKGFTEQLLAVGGLTELTWEAETAPGELWHPGRAARFAQRQATIGRAGELHPDTIARYDLPQRVYAAEIDLETVVSLPEPIKYYQPLPKYPPMERDLALLASETVRTGDLAEAIRAAAGPLLANLAVFDIYRGKQIPEGQKSVAFHLVYRASNRTLTEEEVAKNHENVLNVLKTNWNVTLRDV